MLESEALRSSARPHRDEVLAAEDRGRRLGLLKQVEDT
jgi:hypothetical protein